MVDLRVMDMSKFDVIIGMDWLKAHRVIIDCDRRRVSAYTRDSSCVMFQGDKHDVFTLDSVGLHVAQTVDRLASKPYPRGRGETRFESTSSGL